MTPVPPLPGISAMVLAAGLSRRAAPANKLLLPCDGGTVVRRTVAAFCEAGFAEVIVVTGHERAKVEAALDGLPVRCVFADDFAAGMGRSLAAGIGAAAPTAAGFAVAPGDLPALTAPLVRRIGARFLAVGATRHVIPMTDGRRGHPVVLGSWLRPRLLALDGDAGARRLLEIPSEAARCEYFEAGDTAVWRDVDGPEADFNGFSRRSG